MTNAKKDRSFSFLKHIVLVNPSNIVFPIIRKRDVGAFGEHSSGDGSIYGKDAARNARWKSDRRRHQRPPIHAHAAAKTAAHAAAVDPAAAALVGDGSADG